jgi:membrane protease YdiL (CAAX protease family)
MKNFIIRNSVFIYFALTFLITWGGILVVTGLEGFLGKTLIPESQMPLLYLVTLLGPTISGIILNRIVYGRTGYRKLLNPLFACRRGIQWYLASILLIPILLTAILFVLSLISSSYLPGIFAGNNTNSLLISGITAGIMVGLFEELGWTGFAIPRLRQRFNVFQTGLIVGLLWGLWHMPLFLGNIRNSEEIPPVIYLLVLLFSFLPPIRIIMVWIYDRTKSLFLVILMHASLTASILIFPPRQVTAVQIVTYDLILSVILWLIVAILAIIPKENFAEKPLAGEEHIK